MNVNKSQRSATARPEKPRGRPPLPPGEAKRSPLTIRSTKEMKQALVSAAKASGRPLAQEIEARLQRTLDEDRGKSELEVRLDRAALDLREAMLLFVGYHDIGAVDADTEARAIDYLPGRRAADMEYGEPGEVARVPVEIEVTRGEDGNVVLVSRRGGLVMQEAKTPLDIAAALQPVGDVELAVDAEPKPKRKSA